MQQSFDGLDALLLAETPDFVKTLDSDHARDGEVMIAYAMNGEDLPKLNGFQTRLVVPGYFGTYWLKHLSANTVLDAPFEGHWMRNAYRVPDNDCACGPVGEASSGTVPITKFNVRSFLTNVLEGETVQARAARLRGIAFDGGAGIASLEVSPDGGASWQATTLGEDLGNYSFRQ